MIRRMRKLGACLLVCSALTACGSTGTPGNAHNAQVISAAQHAATSEQSIRRAFLSLPGARTDQLGGVEWLAPGEIPPT